MSSQFSIGRSFKILWGNWCLSVCAAPILVAAAASLGVSSASFSQDGDRGLRLSATALGTYSDNYLRLSDAKMIDRPSLIPEEYSLTTNAQLGWNQRIGRQHLSFNADAGYRFNKYNSNLDTESVSADAALNWKLGARCKGVIAASYARSQGEFEVLDDILHNIVSKKVAEANTHCSFGARLGIVLNGDISTADNSAAMRSINDLEQRQLGASLRLSLRGDDHISLMARQIWRQYANRIVALGQSDENKQLNLGVEVQKSFGPRITLEGWAGYSKLTNENAPTLNYDGFSGKASISYNVGRRHLATFGASQEIDTSTSLTASYIKAKGMYFSISSKWGAKLHSDLELKQDERDIALVPIIIAGSAINNIYDKTKRVSASFGYDIGRLVTLNLSGRLAKRNARLDYFDYTEKAVMVGFSFRYK